VLERSTRMRLAAAVTALTLAAPVWATEIQMKKRDDPKQQSAPAAKPSEESKQKAEGDETKKKPQTKPGCPTDDAFNTLEDLFGLVGPAPALAAAPSDQAGATDATLAAQAPTIEWRDVRATEAQPATESTESKDSKPSKEADQD